MAKLNVLAQTTAFKNNGNWVGLTSTYQSTDGSIHESADVWFTADKAAAGLPQASPPNLSAKVSQLTNAIAAFDVAQTDDKRQGMDLTLPASLAKPELAVADVSGLVEQMKQFDAHGGLFGQKHDVEAGEAVKFPRLRLMGETGWLVDGGR